jgi:8-amino-7-oxononanoate synthase
LGLKKVNMSLEHTLRKHLATRTKENTLRRLKIAPQDTVDFSSNDYLGIAQMKFLKYNDGQFPSNGTGGSRLLSGNKPYHESLEQQLGNYFNAEAFLLFNSGYVANIGLLSCIPQKGDVILLDEYAHICMKEGARLSRAEHYSFKHNDLKDLERRLQRVKAEHVFVVIESVYSMDGDESPLVALVALTEKYGAYLIVDEAHTTGLMPDNGSGLCNALGVSDKVFARIYTFGKAVGAHGAGVAGPQYLKDYLINYSRSFIYTTAIPEHNVFVIQEAVKYRQQNTHLWLAIQEKIVLFKESISTSIPLLPSGHPIQGVLCGSSEKAIRLAAYLVKNGMDVRPIVSPTVPKTKERIRICIHVYNTNKEIISLCKYINEFFGA